MLKDFKEHIENQFPELKQEFFLLACSGGLDSVVLTHLCKLAGLDFALAHCNFKLRGKESEGDEEFVKKLADNLSLEIHITRFDTMSYVNKNKVSIQMAARVLRYDWFEEIMRENGYKILVTAHHANDDLETFLINLSRGTGIDGLTGIPEHTDTIVRPLLQFSHNQIMECARAIKLQWREDSSNEDTKYLRNKIRKEVVPKLNELHPSFMDNFRMTQKYLSGSASILENHIGEIKNLFFKEEEGIFRIATAGLRRLQPFKPYIYALFSEYGFTEWNDVESLLTAMSGKEVRSKTHRLIKDRENLLLQPIENEDSKTYEIAVEENYIGTPIKLSMDPVDNTNERSPRILYVDKETLNHRLTVRKWQKGDYFYPLGMKGRKKISKFFKDEKIDRIAKEKQWLLCSGDEVVWVVGRRGDERFKVTATTKQILKFSLQE